MPGVERVSLDRLLPSLKKPETGSACAGSVPVIDVAKKSEAAEEAWNPDGLVPTVVARLKKEFPELGIITDVALDPYTSHGQDGLIDPADPRGYVLNDETLEALAKQALCHARAGADVVAPSDMMDGRIGRIRAILDAINSFTPASSPIRPSTHRVLRPVPRCRGVGRQSRQGNKNTYQMDPGNSDEALREVALDIEEGADMVMVKPACPTSTSCAA